MFFFFIFIFFAVVIISHYVREYRLKAIKTGEAVLSPTDKSILPFCAKCRAGAVFVFVAAITTGVLLTIERTTGSDVFSLTEKQWANVHLAFVIVFIAMSAFLTYVHSSWFRKLFSQRVKAVR